METMHIARFHLSVGVNEKDFPALGDEFQRLVETILPRLERREVVCGVDGAWVRYVRIRRSAKAVPGFDTISSASPVAPRHYGSNDGSG